MRKLIFFIPFILLAESLLHPDSPKNRDHNSLGFGVAGDVAISDGVFYVGQTGSSLNNGSVYIYSPNAIGGLDQNEILAPIQGEIGFDFGFAIDINNDLMIVGSPHRANIQGGAFLYQKNDTDKWTLIKTISPDSDEWTMDFGSEVAVGEDVILIGDRDVHNGEGKVFTLYKEGEEWRTGSPLNYNYINDDGHFGHSISIDGQKALIGSRDGNVAVQYDFNTMTHSWTESHVFSPYYYQSNGRFGFSVELSGEYAIIGSPGYDKKGFIEIHKLENESWEKVTKISNPEDEVGTYFGASIAMENNQIAVGHFNGEKSFIYSTEDFNTFSLFQTIESPSSHEGKFGRNLELINGHLTIGATYGEKAYIYNTDENNNWALSHDISSDNKSVSIKGVIVPCENGKAGDYDCNSLDLMAYLTPSELSGGVRTELNDIWGWTDSTSGKEYALVGLFNGTSFVDVSNPLIPFVVGFLPTATTSATWRDMKVYKDHVFVVADNAGNHGVQIFDLTQLRGVTEFTEFSMTYHYDLIGSVHNIAINEETGFAYAVGIGSASLDEYKCGAHIIDINDPANPTYAGCLGDKTTGRYNDGYIHDGQFVIYKGPDQNYQGKEIAFTCNETALGIADVTNKENIKIISKFEDNDFGYIHQGWLSKDHKYFFVNDELNEYYGNDDTQTTLIFDLSDLDDPKIINVYDSGLNTIDHNNYVKGDLLFQSNYSAGLRLLSIKDPTNPLELASFDTYPSGDYASFVGSWGNYPYFNSGTIIVSSMEEGLFILKPSPDGNLATGDESIIPENYELKQNYPNPFNPTTQIQYELPHSGNTTLKLYNTLGVEVMTLTNAFRNAGTHVVPFNGTDLPSGIYFYQLRSGDFIKTRKMSLLK
ncbi:MAG: choice-of-anchor B family protein [Candidatus Marinimicrobia bacterium]|jgi:choice-of-anchor B domain-containing protein|nr:choice-of-anchor B family protein [Candidatus Neomarinimicrobiota bacterium]MBT5385474.1 choice-of-anchor B family protein [Candidatus Neomarinimicrobiota bacterium]MDP6755106.1 choice-of-anchor B family protein [Candidatus Neomarinimicrobiota bacterium]